MKPASRLKDTVDDEEAEVPQQQHSQDKGRPVPNIPGALLLRNTPAAPGEQSQSGRRARKQVQWAEPQLNSTSFSMAAGYRTEWSANQNASMFYCHCRFFGGFDALTGVGVNLHRIHTTYLPSLFVWFRQTLWRGVWTNQEAAGANVDLLSDGVDKNHVGENHRQPLEEHRGRAGVVQVLHLQHVAVKVPPNLRQSELEPGEERRVVQSPLGRVLQEGTRHSSQSRVNTRL